MVRYLDLQTWTRLDQYRFYKDYDRPAFNITADVAVTRTLAACRQHGASFFLVSLFHCLKAINEIEAFRYRIRGERVAVHEVIHGGSTVLNEDKTFGFCYFDYDPDPAVFMTGAQGRLERYHRQERKFDPQGGRDDLVYCSVIPWVSFTSFAHASDKHGNPSIPRLVLGKYRQQAGQWRLPVSVEVHHALMDGWHVGRFFQLLERMDETLPAFG